MSTVAVAGRTIVLLIVFTVIVTLFATTIGVFIGCSPWLMLPIVVVLSLVFSLGSALFSDRVVMMMYGVRVVDRRDAPRLYDCIADVAQKAELPMPRVGVMDSATPNAFATGRGPSHALVCATQGLLHTLDDRELRAVIAHEMAHVRNRDILVMSIATALASSMSWMAYMLLFSRERGSFLLYIVGALFAGLAAALIKSAISRTREFGADETGARIVRDPLGLASALYKLERGVGLRPYRGNRAGESMFIVNPFRGGGGIAGLFSTHPSTQDRIDRLEAMAARGDA